MDIEGMHVGRVIRKVRTEKGLTLDDLAEGTDWTSSAISRFEKNRTTPYSKEKIKQLLERLGIMDEQIPYLIEEVRKEEMIRNYLFRNVESQIKQGVIKGGRLKEKLNQINHSTAVKYLRGKQYFENQKYDSAQKRYLSVIENEEDEHYPESNIIPSAYLDLSFISHKQNDYTKALEYVDRGIERYNQDGAKRNVWYSLHYNKAFFLELLGRIKEAEQALEPAWIDRDKIDDILSRIKVYQLKSAILSHYNEALEAFAVLNEGFDLANYNPHLVDGQYYILSELGRVTYNLGRSEYAARCLIAALDLSKKLIVARPTTAHMLLGKIYLSQNDIKKAKKQAKKAIEFATDSQDVNKLIQSHILLGNIFEKEQNKYDSCNHYKAALQLATKYHFDQYKAELHDHLYRCKNT